MPGIGFAMLPDFVAAPEIEAGRLVRILPDYKFLSGGGIYAVYPHRRYLPAKIRVLVDFLAHWFKTHEPACSDDKNLTSHFGQNCSLVSRQ